MLAGAGRGRSQKRAAEEGHFDVAREDVERQEPTLALDSIQGRVPLHRLAHVGHVPHDERVEALPEVALPARHRGDVGLHRRVALRLRDLRIAAREQDDLLAFSHVDRLDSARTRLGRALARRACTRRALDLRLRLGAFPDALHVAAIRRCPRYAICKTGPSPPGPRSRSTTPRDYP